MERNHILAFVLCFVVIIATQYYIAMTTPPQPKPAAGAASGDEPEPGTPTSTPAALSPESPTSTAPLPAGIGAPTSTSTSTSTSTAPLAEPAAAAIEERVFPLENDHLRLVLDNRGAAITSALVKDHFDYRPTKKALLERPPLDLLEAFPGGSRSLGLALDGGAALADAVWQVEVEGRSAVFTTAWKGVAIAKEVVLGDGFDAQVTLRFVNGGAKRVKVDYELDAATALKREEPKPDDPMLGVAGIRSGDAVELESFEPKKLPKLGEAPKELGGAAFGGVASRYFAIALCPGADVERPVIALRQTEGKLVGSGGQHALGAAAACRVQGLALDPGKEVVHTYRLFIGPKAEDAVAPLAQHGLDKLIDLSSFVPLAETLSLLFIAFLHKLNALLRSYGVAIIVLTLVVRGLLHPLSAKSQRSAYRMQKIAPRIKEVQARYEGKRSREQMAKMQGELAELYRKHGVSPVAGCLPLFLQLPVFIALYNALAHAFELRQQGFLWISDLTKPDRTLSFGVSLPWPIEGYLNVLPLVMAVVMYVQQSMSPKPADPQQEQQQKMMRMITFIFPVLFYTVPSGLVLYFLVSSLVGLVETRFIKKQLAREDEAAVAPALA